MAKLLIPTCNRVLFAPADAVSELLSEWQKKKVTTTAAQEKRLENTLKDLAMLKTTCANSNDDGSFQNLKFTNVNTAKITICNNAFIWTNKITGCAKSHFKDDSHKHIPVYKILNSGTVQLDCNGRNTKEKYKRIRMREGRC